MTDPLLCPYCGSATRLMLPQDVYSGSGASMYAMLWACVNFPKCDAYVGCHPATTEPLGRLANKELRQAKMVAHAAFDRLWKGKARKDQISNNHARRLGYAWLAAQLGIAPAQCHIGMFDVAQCQRVVNVCKPYHRGGIQCAS